MNYTAEKTTVTHESTFELFRDLRDEAMILIRQQVELAKAEMNEKVSSISRNAIYLAAGSLVAYAGLLFVLLGLSRLGVELLVQLGLTVATATWLSPVILGAIVGLIGYFLVNKAIKTFKNTSVVPVRTLHSIKEDQQWLTKKKA